MTRSSQHRAVESHRAKLAQRGLVRFELQALKADRDLIRKLARKLIEEGPEAGQLRRTVEQAVGGGAPKTGGILAALRRSPLVGDELDFSRSREEGRHVDL
jgi:hypothetical protein